MAMGILIEPLPGWKTYWRAAGESGLPPVFAFRRHDNTALPQIIWPAPKRLHVQGLEAYGYDGPVIFPFTIQPRDATLPVRLEIHVDYAVCRDICVPEQAVLRLNVPPAAATATPHAQALLAAIARAPATQGGHSRVRILTAYVRQTGSQLVLSVEAEADNGFSAPDLFADGPAGLFFLAPRISYDDTKHKAAFDLGIKRLDPSTEILGQTITLTLVDGETAVETQVKLAEPPQIE